MHDFPLITTVAAAFAAAWVLGLITQRLGLSPIVGYLLGGIVIGPHTPGFEGDIEVANQLAEIGVILLMFGVGLHFHLKELLDVRRIAVPGAIGQIVVATALGTLVALAFNWGWTAGIVFGLAISVASTVVLVRVLSDNRDLHTPTGHIAVGWLVVEDLFTVAVLAPYLTLLAVSVLAIRHLVLPLIAWGLALALRLPPAQGAVLMAFSAVPTASSAYVLAARMGYNGPFVAGLVTLSTLLGMLSLPFALSLPR